MVPKSYLALTYNCSSNKKIFQGTGRLTLKKIHPVVDRKQNSFFEVELKATLMQISKSPYML